MTNFRRAGRTLKRFLGAVLLVSGALLIIDAALTLLWQEPISAIFAGRHQAALARELPQQPEPPRIGEGIGRLSLPTLKRSYVVVEGVGTSTLRKGPGHYPDTSMPGRRGTVAVAGHRTTYLAPFRTIDRLEPGAPIVFDMPYGRFTYRVEKTQIVSPTATRVKRQVRHDRLVLTACHPLYSAAQRIVVFARLDGKLA